MYPGLADLLEPMGRTGQLTRVAATVSPLVEASEITRRVVRSGGPALLFGRVEGHRFPAVTGLFATPARIVQAWGVPSLAIARQQVAGLIETGEPEGWADRLAGGSASASLRRFAPKRTKTGPCQQVVLLGRDVDLAALPALQSWPDESGRTITAARLFVLGAGGQVELGRYDLGVLDHNRLVACWQAHDRPARHLGASRRLGVPLQLALVLGGDALGLLAAMAPLPEGVDPSAIAGFFRQRPVEMVKCRTSDLEVPADAEIVIEGFIDPEESPVDGGLRGAPNGFCRAVGCGPVVHVAAVTHRANPVFPAMVPGPPPNEFTAIGAAVQTVFLPLVQQALPELVDCHLPEFGAARHWAVVAIRKSFAGQARKVASALWGLEHLMFVKLLVIVDEEIDVRDLESVLLAVATEADIGADLFVQQGPCDPWDPATSAGGLASRVAIDATRKLTGEGRGDRAVPGRTPDVLRRLVDDRWSEYGLP